MIMKTLLFLTYIVLVSSNNGSPIILAQTYPIYQQNGYANPSANLPSQITPYLQDMTVQNHLPTYNLSPSDMRQILLNRILSTPQAQTILNQNLRSYGSNLADFNNYPIAQNSVGNYFVPPTAYEYLNNQTSIANNVENETNTKSEGKRKKHSRRRSSTSRRQNDSENNHKHSKNNKETNEPEENNRERNKKSRKRSRKQNDEVSSPNKQTKNNDTESNKTNKTKKRKNKEKAQTNNEPIAEHNKDENHKPRRRHRKKPKKEDEAEKVVSEKQVKTKAAQKEIQDNLNLSPFNEGITEENRVTRNLRSDGNDLLKLIPNLPENLGYNFNLKGMPQFENNPYMSNFFANYENIYQSMMANRKETTVGQQVSRKKPKRSRNSPKRIVVKNLNSTEKAIVPINTNAGVNPKINIVTTEKTLYINEKIRTNIDPIPKEEVTNSFDKPTIKKEEIKSFDDIKVDNVDFEPQTTNIKDLQQNDELEYFSNGYIDDYYPLFTDSAAYNANNKEVYIKNLGDTKYYYATDKKNLDPINRMRFESFGFPERIIKDYERNKAYTDVEKGSNKKAKLDTEDIIKEEIQFQTPPLLEAPDFQTRKIERSEIRPELYYNFDDNLNHRFVGDKSLRTPNHTGTKINTIPAKTKDVETVYAKSKVVKYGAANSFEDDTASAEPVQTANDDSHFKDGGTVYVLAKSLDYPD